MITLGDGGIETGIGLYIMQNFYLDIICGSHTGHFDPIPIITCYGAWGEIVSTFVLFVVLVMVLWGRPKNNEENF